MMVIADLLEVPPNQQRRMFFQGNQHPFEVNKLA